MIDWISIGLFFLCALLFSWVLWEKVKVNDLKNDKIDLQLENSDLIERNQKLDTYLDKARAEAVKANHKIMKLEYTEKVYLAVDRNERIWFAYRSQKDLEDTLEVRKDLKIKIIMLDDPK